METFYRIRLINNGIYGSDLNERKELRNIANYLKLGGKENGYRISKKIKGNEMELKILGRDRKVTVMPESMCRYLSSKRLVLREFIKTRDLGIDEFEEIRKELYLRSRRMGPIATVKKRFFGKHLEVYVF